MNTHRATNGRTGRGLAAFTLVELLVVVSIIALLISILLPSLKKAREQTKSAVCIADLKSISTASIVYSSDDPVESAVPVHAKVRDPSVDGVGAGLRLTIARLGWGGKSGAGKEGSDVLFWGTGRKMGPATRPMNKYLYKSGFVDYFSNPGVGAVNWNNDKKLNLDQFRCPSDKGYQGINSTAWRDSKLTAYDHYGNSYATNIIFIYVPGSNSCPSGSGSCCESNSAALKPYSRIPNPANTMYYVENVGRSAFFADPQGLPGAYSCGASPYASEVVHGWHGKDWMFNASFADAHASTVKIKGFENPRLTDYPESGGWADAYQFWKCVIIRGRGYQMDTLPAPPILTDIPCN